MPVWAIQPVRRTHPTSRRSRVRSGRTSNAGFRKKRRPRGWLASGPTSCGRSLAPPAGGGSRGYLADPLVLLLIAAAAISLVVWMLEGTSGWPIETVVILAIVVVNAVLGYVQEARAERIVAALRSLTELTATVVRDGGLTEIAASEVVPGDLLVIETGDAIAADARLVREVSLATGESALTGESEPVEKDTEAIAADTQVADRTNMVFSGTIAASGRGRAIVTATGMETELGGIAHLLGTIEDPVTPLQREIARIGRVAGHRGDRRGDRGHRLAARDLRHPGNARDSSRCC